MTVPGPSDLVPAVKVTLQPISPSRQSHSPPLVFSPSYNNTKWFISIWCQYLPIISSCDIPTGCLVTIWKNHSVCFLLLLFENSWLTGLMANTHCPHIYKYMPMQRFKKTLWGKIQQKYLIDYLVGGAVCGFIGRVKRFNKQRNIL
jgi:hypothetical protein